MFLEFLINNMIFLGDNIPSLTTARCKKTNKVGRWDRRKQDITCNRKSSFNYINSEVGGMAVVLWNRFLSNPIYGSASWFFVIILQLILTLIFEIKIHAKKLLDTLKFHFRCPIFIIIKIMNILKNYNLRRSR